MVIYIYMYMFQSESGESIYGGVSRPLLVEGGRRNTRTPDKPPRYERVSVQNERVFLLLKSA